MSESARTRSVAMQHLAFFAKQGMHQEVRAYVMSLEKQIRDLQPHALPRVWRQNEQLKLIVEDLMKLCLHADFSNEVTDPTGSIDEGVVKSLQFLEEIEKRYKSVIQ